MLTPRDSELLLYDLCVRLGFCLPPDDIARLEAGPPSTPEEYADAVFRAERMDPLKHRRLYGQVHATIKLAFERAAARDPGPVES